MAWQDIKKFLIYFANIAATGAAAALLATIQAQLAAHTAGACVPASITDAAGLGAAGGSIVHGIKLASKFPNPIP